MWYVYNQWYDISCATLCVCVCVYYCRYIPYTHTYDSFVFITFKIYFTMLSTWKCSRKLFPELLIVHSRITWSAVISVAFAAESSLASKLQIYWTLWRRRKLSYCSQGSNVKTWNRLVCQTSQLARVSLRSVSLSRRKTKVELSWDWSVVSHWSVL